MGAEPWSCFVPYQADIEAALFSAHQQEFAAGRYRMRDQDNPPATLVEVYQQANAVSGTCSVLDMIGVIDTPHEVEYEPSGFTNFGMVAPLSDGQILQLYGTERPTHEM